MWKVMICDDEEEMRRAVRENLLRFSDETGERFSVFECDSGEALLFNLTDDTDIVFLDIKMGGINGMDAARRIREKNSKICLIFITTMTQYAIEGYEVHAFGFLKKPLTYAQMRLQMTDVLRHLKPLKAESLNVKTAREIHAVSLPEIVYLEVLDHDLRIVCSDNVVVSRNSLADMENQLEGKGFFRVHKGYCINLSHVKKIGSDSVLMDNAAELPVSKHRKKEFLEAFAKFAGGGVI